MQRNTRSFAITGALLLASSNAVAQGETAASAAAVAQMKGFAASSLQAPVAFGASWGTFGFGVYGQTFTDRNEDGSAGFAFGLGDPAEYAALEVAVASSSLTDSNSDDSFGESGSFGFKLHTSLPGYAAVAMGVNGTGRWGSDEFKNNNSSSVYVVATKFVPVGKMGAILNIGLGDNLYNEAGEDGVGVIASGALYFTHWFSVLAEYTGRFTNAAVSVAPFPRSFPLSVTLGATNLGEEQGGDVEFAGSVGMGFSF